MCPYCGETDSSSEDHIFSAFLGGRRTVPACARCNNTFGNSFEGRISEPLLRLKAALTACGVALKWDRNFRWKEGYVHEGVTSDVVVTDGRVFIVRSKPQIIRNEEGKVIRVLVRSDSEGRRIAEDLKRKGKIRQAKQTSETGSVKFENFRFDLKTGLDIGRLCLKMCVAAATLLPDFARSNVNLAVPISLDGTNLPLVKRDGRTHPMIDAARPPLAHVIFVERNTEGTYGIVQFFGSLQFYCRIGDGLAGEPQAILGVLDAVQGIECFGYNEAAFIPDLPQFISNQDHAAEIAGWARKMIVQMRQQGASVEDLRLEMPRRRWIGALFESGTSAIWPFAEIPREFF
jgi:hypothetical protein